jgi:hypothetical protein
MILLAKEQMQKTSLFAVVVDYFEPVEFNGKEGTVHYMNVKVIDDTLNKKDTFRKGKTSISFAYIKFTNKSGENLPKIVNVGDIVRIRRFSFSFGIEEESVLSGHEQVFSNWMVFDASDNWNKRCSKNLIKEENYRDLYPTEKERFLQLVDWTKSLFTKNSI